MSRKIKLEYTDLDYDIRPVRLPTASRKTDVQPRARIVEAAFDDEEDPESNLIEALSSTEGTISSGEDTVSIEGGIEFAKRSWDKCVCISDTVGSEYSTERPTLSAYDGDSELSSLDSESDDDFEPGEQNTGASFEDLPPEIRNKIYHLALVDEDPILAVYHPTKSNKCNLYSAAGGIRNHASIRSLGPRMRGFPVQLLRTNKAVSVEAAKVFYGANTLVFWIGKAPVNYMDFFFGPTTNDLQPRSTLAYMRNIKLIELADHDSIKKITKRFKEAAKAARKAGEPMALNKMYVRKLQWKQDQIVAELVPMLRALRKCQPKESLESSGVLELVEFISWDKGASALQIRQANDRNKLIRKALKVSLQAME